MPVGKLYQIKESYTKIYEKIKENKEIRKINKNKKKMRKIRKKYGK